MALAACDAHDERGGDAGRLTTNQRTVVSRVSAESLRFETRVPLRVSAGHAFPIVLSVRNIGPHAATLSLIGRTVVFDIVITGRDGRILWRRQHGASVPAILRMETLAPGEERTFEDRWFQRTNDGEVVAPGLYSVHGEFPTDAPNPLRTPTVLFRIEPE